MHRVEMLEVLLALADRHGYTIRQEWLGGRGGGACEIAGKRFLFLDLALNVTEQLAVVAEALQRDPSFAWQGLPSSLQPLFERRAA